MKRILKYKIGYPKYLRYTIPTAYLVLVIASYFLRQTPLNGVEENCMWFCFGIFDLVLYFLLMPAGQLVSLYIDRGNYYYGGTILISSIVLFVIGYLLDRAFVERAKVSKKTHAKKR